MPDREKVIEGIEHCDFGASDTCYEKECPYYRSHDCTDELKNDILAMLKEQEPVAPVLVGRMWECGKCHAPVGIFMDDRRDQFCRTCGRAVEWYD